MLSLELKNYFSSLYASMMTPTRLFVSLARKFSSDKRTSEKAFHAKAQRTERQKAQRNPSRLLLAPSVFLYLCAFA
jgi:hypothetical protein